MPNRPKFWNFARDETTGGRELYIDGDIAEDAWFGDEVTPRSFKAELFAGTGDITVWINSYGGSVFAASQIYTMLMDYQWNVTAKVYGMCASAASVISMAAGKVLMSPTAMMFVHNPMTIAFGNKSDLQKSIAFLDEVKEAILNAYEIKSGLSRAKLSHLLDDETPMNVHKAIALGFADDILVDEKRSAAPSPLTPQDSKPPAPAPSTENTTTVKSCYARLNLLSGGFLHD
jgi:ATP-dependent Clp protease protease subunit